jgi:hypothetical protein
MESLNIFSQDCYTYTGSVCIQKGDYMQDNQNQTHWIYAAAIMDSDGCFMISRYKRGHRYDYLPNVKISMINNGSINYIQKETGLGYVMINGTRPSRPNSLPLYEWRITNKIDLITFLNGIMPYLQNKKERAQHLLDFCRIGNFKEYGQRHIRLTQEELNYREQAYIKMRELNANKVGATTKS